MASVSSLDDGVSSRSTSVIANPTVDNGTYNYALAAEIDSAPLILYGARIGYSAPVWPAARAAGDRPSAAAAPGGPPAADPTVGLEASAARYTSGQVIFLAPPSAGPAGVDKTASVGSAAGPNPLAVGNPVHWQRYALPASTFHPAYSETAHTSANGGGRYVTAAPSSGTPSLVTSLDLIDGQTIRQVKFTYYDVSSTDPMALLYRVDRQGHWLILWNSTPAASGGYFTAVSPPMNEVVDNQNYAYYFVVNLGQPPVGADLKAMKVEVDYVLDAYLPLILKNY